MAFILVGPLLNPEFPSCFPSHDDSAVGDNIDYQLYSGNESGSITKGGQTHPRKREEVQRQL